MNLFDQRDLQDTAKRRRAIARQIFWACLPGAIGLIGVIAIGIAFSGCASTQTSPSADVDQTQIYQSYTVSGSAAGTSTITAQFRFGGSLGTTLALTSPSQVTYNAALMAPVDTPFTGTYYSTEGAAAGSSQFVFTDTSGKTYANTISLPSVGFASPPATLSRSTYQTLISFTGGALGPGESVELDIAPSQNANDASYSATVSDLGATSILVQGSSLANLYAGTHSMTLTRRSAPPLSQLAAIGGDATASYTCAAVTVDITK
jgi:hypothetical protein